MVLAVAAKKPPAGSAETAPPVHGDSCPVSKSPLVRRFCAVAEAASAVIARSVRNRVFTDLG